MRKKLLPFLPFLFITLALEIAVRIGVVKAFIIPPPSAVFRCFFTDSNELLNGALSTALSAFAGLALSIGCGMFFSVLLSLSRTLRDAFYPYAVFFQTVPVISIAPILVIWFGFGRPTVVASAFIVSIFPVIASTLLGLESTELALVDLFALYSANAKDRLFKLRLPFAQPQIFSGLRIAAGLAVIGAVVGEFVGGGGLGSVVDAARTTQRIDLVFAAVLISSLIGLVFVALVNLVSWLALHRWHASENRR